LNISFGESILANVLNIDIAEIILYCKYKNPYKNVPKL